MKITKSLDVKKIARILSVIYILFISIFALDVFSPEYSPLQILIGLFMHLIPTFIFIFALLIAWRNEKLGGVMFIMLAIISVLFFHTYENFVSFLIISSPLFIIGGLFVYSAHISN